MLLLGALALGFLLFVLRGRGGRPIAVAEAVKASTSGAFYHWRSEGTGGRREGWCALRRSRTRVYRDGRVAFEERRSPTGVYRRQGEKTEREPGGAAVVGMEMGNDPLAQAALRLSGGTALLHPLGGRRFRAGAAVYTLEASSIRIVAIETPGERIAIDYPASLDSSLFEAP